MPLFRIVVCLVVLVVCAAVLSIVFNLLKAIAIVAALGLVAGIVLALRRNRRRVASLNQTERRSPARDRK